jgi:hypothetical protein
MGGLISGLGFIISKIVAAVQWIGQLFVKVFTALWDLLRDLACWVFDGFLGLSVSILNTFDFSGFAAYVGSWASLPAGVKDVIAAIGLGTAFGIVATAIGIRVVLQLIPFTRLGS